ncbi:LytR/AlgR family response regulator transcription factor [Listeria ilorinensis]|uniref:LytR/AlgR family response regulator transcription factor n=1 Tax=Listeria ilorinensis TaxID=2867439 RepID=UPI001EF5FDB1|nr:LytTR family DNA-binding domain-containing protein [Listeria ilorinensis]
MLPVYVCEDNRVQRERLTKYIQDYIMVERFDMELKLATADPYEMLEQLKSNHQGKGLYFLDIDLQQPDMNGFELATEIRKVDPRGFIIFITTHAELTYLTFTYKVEALDYIIKDNINELQERVLNCMKSVDQRMMDDKETEKYFTFQVSDKKIIHEKMDDILFFETSSKIHKIILHGKNRQTEFYAKMKEIEKLLGEPFYRCHRSYLVNKDNISELDLANGVVVMSNGEECIASAKLMRGLKVKMKI